MTEIKKVPVHVAAVIMDKSPQFVRRGLIAGKFPFGVAVSSDEDKIRSRHNYYINPQKFMDYTGCTLADLQAVIGGDSNE